jgi:hypothetical protein
MAPASLAYALSSLNGTKHGSHLPVAFIHTEIHRTSGIVRMHPKGTGHLLYPSRCRPLQAPRDFIRSSSSPPSDLNPAIDGARGTLNFRDRKREERT